MSDETTSKDGYPICMCAMLAHQHLEGCPVKRTIDRLQQRVAELERLMVLYREGVTYEQAVHWIGQDDE